MPSVEERRASLEVIGRSYRLLLSRIPLLPYRWRWALCKSYIKGLSQTTLSIYGGQIVQALCFSKTYSVQFRNTQHEVEHILIDVPELGHFRGILREKVKGERRKYKLKV